MVCRVCTGMHSEVVRYHVQKSGEVAARVPNRSSPVIGMSAFPIPWAFSAVFFSFFILFLRFLKLLEIFQLVHF